MKGRDDLSGQLDLIGNSDFDHEALVPGLLPFLAASGVSCAIFALLLAFPVDVAVELLAAAAAVRALGGYFFFTRTDNRRIREGDTAITTFRMVRKLPVVCLPVLARVLLEFCPTESTAVLAGGALLLHFLTVPRVLTLYRNLLYAIHWVPQDVRASARRIRQGSAPLRLFLLIGGLAAQPHFSLLFALLGLWSLRLHGVAKRIVHVQVGYRTAKDIGRPFAPGCWSPVATRLSTRRSLALALFILPPLAILASAISPAPKGTISEAWLRGSLPFLALVPLSWLALLWVYRPALRRTKSLEEEIHGILAKEPDKSFLEFVIDRLRGAWKPVPKGLGEGLTTERDHVLVGFLERFGRVPLLYPESGLERGVYITGAPGSGKSRYLIALTMQLIRRLRGKPNEEADPEERASFVFLDLKGDRALLHSVREEAAKAGQEFFYLSLDETAPGYRFNPLETLLARPRDPATLTSQLMGLLGVLHGDFYGSMHFGAEGQAYLGKAVREPGALESLDALSRALQRHTPKTKSLEVANVLQRVAGYRILHCSGDSPPRVRFEELLEKRQIAYFSLDPQCGEQASREVGRIALGTLLHAAAERQKEGKKTICYVPIDEFQTLASSSADLERILEKGRGFGLRFILAHQNPASLRVSQYSNLSSVVRNCTRLKVMFTVDDPEELKGLVYLSGEQVIHIKAVSMDRDGNMLPSWHGVYRPRVEPVEVRRASSAEQGCVILAENAGDLCWFNGEVMTAVAESPLLRPVHEKRANLPLPRIELAYPEPSGFDGLLRRDGILGPAKEPLLPLWMEEKPEVIPVPSEMPPVRSERAAEREKGLHALFSSILSSEQPA